MSLSFAAASLLVVAKSTSGKLLQVVDLMISLESIIVLPGMYADIIFDDSNSPTPNIESRS